jgi:hypothetical protein
MSDIHETLNFASIWIDSTIILLYHSNNVRKGKTFLINTILAPDVMQIYFLALFRRPLVVRIQQQASRYIVELSHDFNHSTTTE